MLAEANTFSEQGIEIGRSNDAGVEGPEVPISHIVGNNQEDVLFGSTRVHGRELNSPVRGNYNTLPGT